MEKGSIGTIILIVAVIVAIIAEMAYRQVKESLRREGKEIYVFDHLTYLFKYRKMINEGYLQDDDSKSTYRLYVKSSILLFCILILGLINIYTDGLLILQ